MSPQRKVEVLAYDGSALRNSGGQEHFLLKTMNMWYWKTCRGIA